MQPIWKNIKSKTHKFAFERYEMNKHFFDGIEWQWRWKRPNKIHLFILCKSAPLFSSQFSICYANFIICIWIKMKFCSWPRPEAIASTIYINNIQGKLIGNLLFFFFFLKKFFSCICFLMNHWRVRLCDLGLSENWFEIVFYYFN